MNNPAYCPTDTTMEMKGTGPVQGMGALSAGDPGAAPASGAADPVAAPGQGTAAPGQGMAAPGQGMAAQAPGLGTDAQAPGRRKGFDPWVQGVDDLFSGEAPAPTWGKDGLRAPERTMEPLRGTDGRLLPMYGPKPLGTIIDELRAFYKVRDSVPMISADAQLLWLCLLLESNDKRWPAPLPFRVNDYAVTMNVSARRVRAALRELEELHMITHHGYNQARQSVDLWSWIPAARLVKDRKLWDPVPLQVKLGIPKEKLGQPLEILKVMMNRH